jgi:soluble lytic murein transglycosylase-like protein
MTAAIALCAAILTHPPLPTYQKTCDLDLAIAIRDLALTEYRQFPAHKAVSLAEAANAAGRAHDLDPTLLIAISWYESRFQSASGDCVHVRCRALGVMQMSRSALRAVRPDLKHRELLDVRVAYDSGAAYLARLRRLYPGHVMPVYGAGPKGRRWKNTPMGKRKLKLARQLRSNVRTCMRLDQPSQVSQGD